MSSSNLGLPTSEGEAMSAARRNAMMVMSGKGTEISAIPTTQQIPFFRCIESSGGLLVDENYFKSADGLSIKNFRRKHLHNLETDTAGGLLLNSLVYNPRNWTFGDKGFNTINDFIHTNSGAATFTEGSSSTLGRYFQLTSTWSGSVGEYRNASVMSGGTILGFSEKILGIIKMYMDYQINQVARIGFGMEEVQNTVDVTRKAGMEMCGSTGINWQGVSSNGVTRTVTATSMGASTYPNPKTYRIYFNPTNASIKISNNDGVLKIITSTIPSGGGVDPNRIFRIGLQTTNSTPKIMTVSRVQFIGKNDDSTWFDGPE
jgi:hypothetical protein